MIDQDDLMLWNHWQSFDRK